MSRVCKRGHPQEGENVYVRPDGKRQCRVCKALRAKGIVEQEKPEYDYAELRYRPIEHVLEYLTPVQIEEILGSEARRNIEPYLTDEGIKKIRDWLEAQ